MKVLISSFLLIICTSFNTEVTAQQFNDTRLIIGKTTDGNAYDHGDLDNDGDQDIVVGGLTGLRWIENNGTGGYGRYIPIDHDDLELFPSEIRVGDINGDDLLDVLVISNESSNRLLAYSSSDLGEAWNKTEVMSNPNLDRVELADLDGDTDLDLILSLKDPSNDILIYENDGQGQFTQVLALNNVGSGLENITIGNLGGSGLPDILACTIGDDLLVWYENEGGLSFGDQLLISTAHDYPRNIAISDVDGDTFNDVLCSSLQDEDLAWFENMGDGSFGGQNIILNANEEPRFFAADVDNDDDIDLLTDTGEDQVMEFLENDGSGNFSDPIPISGFRPFYWLSAFDVDNDGDVDPIYAGFSPQSDRGSLRFVPNNENDGFSNEEFLTFGLNDCEALDYADLDGDGLQDVLGVSSTDDKVYWSRNLSNGNFDVPILLSDSVANVHSILATDIDNDGDYDVLAVERGYSNAITNNRVHVYENNGVGEFTLGAMIEHSFPGGNAAYTFVFAEDVTGNSFPDVFVLSYDVSVGSEQIYKWNNLGGMSFSPRVTVATVSSVQSLEFADLDGIQGVDMVYTSGNTGSDEVNFRLNDGTGNFPVESEVSLAPLGLLGFNVGESLALGDMDGDGDQDIVGSFRYDLGSSNQSSMQMVTLVNDGNAVFSEFVMIENTYGLCYDIELGDMDGDNDLDVVGIDIYGAGWWRNDNDGDFTRLVVDSIVDGEILLGEIISNRCLKLADLDNDTDLDVLHTNIAGSFTKRHVKWTRNEVIDCAVLPTLSPNGSVSICEDESLTLTASNGSSFSWNEGLPDQAVQTVSPTETTTFVVTIANGESCSITDSVTVNVIPFPVMTIEASACDAYTAADGTVYTESGQYTSIVDNPLGCDSIITINLVIEDLEAPLPNLPELPNVVSECPVLALDSPSAQDNCAGEIVGLPDITLPIAETTTIVWTYDDGNGNVITQEQSVVINDVTAPTPELVELEAIVAECELTNLVPPNATDNCDGVISGTQELMMPITESTMITWSFEDGSGNVSTQTQQVIIQDTTPPVPEVAQLEDVVSECEVNELIAPLALDNCSGTITGVYDGSFPITSSTVITWIFEDEEGNVFTQDQQIVIEEIDNSITEIGLGMIEASADGYTYQWLDCNNNFEPISGATSQVLTVTENGDYAVEISNGTCSVISDCLNIIIVGVENESNIELVVYPNPTANYVTVIAPSLDRLTMVNLLGQVVYDESNLTQPTIQIDLPEEAGVYLLRAEVDGFFHIVQVVKQ